jgi:hypothetical protein
VGVEPQGLSTVCSPMHTAVAGWGQGAGTKVAHRGGCESVKQGWNGPPVVMLWSVQRPWRPRDVFWQWLQQGDM